VTVPTLRIDLGPYAANPVTRLLRIPARQENQGFNVESVQCTFVLASGPRRHKGMKRA